MNFIFIIINTIKPNSLKISHQICTNKLKRYGVNIDDNINGLIIDFKLKAVHT